VEKDLILKAMRSRSAVLANHLCLKMKIKNKKNKYKYVKSWREKNPEKDKAHKMAYNLKHRKELNDKLKTWQKNNRDKIKVYFKSWSVKNETTYSKYKFLKKVKVLNINLSYEDYLVMVESQKNLCAICKIPETAKHKSGTTCLLSIDHCHKTKKVRGLLCKKCNTALGFFEDDLSVILNAYSYIKQNEL